MGMQSKMFDIKITVFTPTFNRGYIIEQAYNSLCKQTVKDFEWLVIDDGSSDNTETLFNIWKKEDNGFDIIYIKQENCGKMRAVNRGAQMARGELFLNLDSDDFLADDTIEKIIYWEKTICDKKECFAGIAGLRRHHDGSLIGTTFKGEHLDISILDISKYGISGDRVEVFYTGLLKKHPFPEIEGEKFFPEGVTWAEICFEENKILRYVNETFIYCEYLSDGYSNSALQLSLDNPKGVCLQVKKMIKYKSPSYFGKMKYWHKYINIGRLLGYSPKSIMNDLNISKLDYLFVVIGKKAIDIVRKLQRKNGKN